MTFRIETLEGIPIELKEQGLYPLRLEIDSLSPIHITEEIEGMDGLFEIETTYEPRTMRASFYMEAKDNYSKLRSKAYKLFNGKQPFYIIDNDEPHKKWKVKTLETFTPERFNRLVGSFTVELISSSPFAESNGSTLNPSQHFQVSTNDMVQYSFDTTSFSIWNDGDTAIDPRQHKLVIEYKGKSNNLTVRNNTNGTEWKYTGTSNANDIIKIDGVRSFKNGVSIFGNTNRKLITLEEGWNDFVITGATTPFTISFDFFFLYI